MDYREYLLHPVSKRFVDLLVLEIFRYPSDFDRVYRLIFDTYPQVSWRAAWACQKISEKHPEWFSEAHFNEITALSLYTKHFGLLRGCLSTLNNLKLPRQISVEFINACFDWMVSIKYPVAIQSLSMKMLFRICKVEPDFKHELLAYLENVDPTSYSAGFNSTRTNLLKRLINR